MSAPLGMRRLLSTFAVLLLLSSCATGYGRVGWTGGFTERQVTDTGYIVAFNGNGFTSAARAADFCLLRCAEIALKRGYPYFVIVNEDHLSYTSSYTTPVNTVGNNTYGGQTYYINKPRSTNAILLLEHQPEQVHFNAQAVYDAIQRKYKIKK